MRKSPSHRRFWNTLRSSPRSRAAVMSASASAEVGAIGLSITRGRPCSSAAMASGTWKRLGVEITTRSWSAAAAHRSSARSSTRASG